MNVFNRIAMSLILLVFIIGIIVLALLPKPVIDAVNYALAIAEDNMTPATQLAGSVIGLLLAVGAFFLLVAELRPPSRQSVVLAQVAGGTAELTNESVALRVKRVAEALSGVREAAPSIKSHGKMVSISLRLVTDPDIDIPQKSEEVMQAVRAETETKMGVPIKTLRVTVKHSYQERRASTSDRPDVGDSLRV